MKNIKVNKSTVTEDSLTDSPQCVHFPLIFTEGSINESLHKAHSSAYTEEKQLPEFKQTNGKNCYVSHPIKSQRITIHCVTFIGPK